MRWMGQLFELNFIQFCLCGCRFVLRTCICATVSKRDKDLENRFLIPKSLVYQLYLPTSLLVYGEKNFQDFFVIFWCSDLFEAFTAFSIADIDTRSSFKIRQPSTNCVFRLRKAVVTLFKSILRLSCLFFLLKD